MAENLPHSWEMSPRYRVLDSVVRCSHGEGEGAARWQLHLIKQPGWNYAFLWLRPLDETDDAGFVLQDSRFAQTRMFSAAETLAGLEGSFAHTLADDLLVRRFVLNTRGGLRQGNQRAHEIITVDRGGVAAWRRGLESNSTPFLWRLLKTPWSGADFIKIPAAQIWDELQKLLADPNGEAQFARAFSQLDPLARRARIQKPARGTLDQLNRLLRDVVLAAPQWDELTGELYLSVDEAGAARMWEIGRAAPDELETPDWVREHVRRLWDYFAPFDPSIADFLCVRGSDANSLFARAFAPSTHQRLEAQLRLRDWRERAGV